RAGADSAGLNSWHRRHVKCACFDVALNIFAMLLILRDNNITRLPVYSRCQAIALMRMPTQPEPTLHAALGLHDVDFLPYFAAPWQSTCFSRAALENLQAELLSQRYSRR